MKSDPLKNVMLVTGLLNIDQTKKKKTSKEDFLDRFSNLAKLRNDIFLFCEEEDKESIKDVLSDNKKKNCQIVLVDEVFKKSNLFAYDSVKRMQEIQEEAFFKRMIASRPCKGEDVGVTWPEYNAAVYSKVDFTSYVSEFTKSEHKFLSWVDFGLIRDENLLPDDLLFDPTCLYEKTKGKVSFIADQECHKRTLDSPNWYLVLLHFWNPFGGGAFLVERSEVAQRFKSYFYREVNVMLDSGIFDRDEQIFHMLKVKMPKFLNVFGFENKNVLNYLEIKDEKPKFIV